MSQLKALTEKVVAFRDEREWKQFHNPKDLALSMLLESAELLELFQWKDAAATQNVATTKKDALADELADVFYYSLLMSHDLGIDLHQALIDKLAKNAAKYPAEKARGSNKKYTELEP
jgi:NTP pyrophosphatase (non-canonical NTP hydrolase)